MDIDDILFVLFKCLIIFIIIMKSKKDSKCRMHEKCNLCGHERLGQTRHNWKYDESGQKICLDCKETV